tara:strand:- start:2412 stop:3275 length:864 start_codon:yes stop_codon:yes gene_type:complete
MPSYLVTGAGGQLGQCFQYIASEFPQYRLFFPTHPELDINKSGTLSNYFEKSPFTGIINCAGHTEVDKAETEDKEAYQINAWGVQNLIDFAEAKNLKLIHFSTDFVFDGTKKTPYMEGDTTNPLNVYGKSKLAGELALAKSNCQGVCIRLSWLFSPFGKNFVKTIINFSKSTTELVVVNDQFGKPTYGIDLARAVLTSLSNPNFYKYKTYHFAQGPDTNWYDFAQSIIKLTGLNCGLKPINSSAYSKAAMRPMNSSLSTQLIEKTLSLNIRHWHLALEDCLKKIQDS